MNRGKMEEEKYGMEEKCGMEVCNEACNKVWKYGMKYDSMEGREYEMEEVWNGRGMDVWNEVWKYGMKEVWNGGSMKWRKYGMKYRSMEIWNEVWEYGVKEEKYGKAERSVGY